MAMSGDIFGCHNYSWHLVGTAGDVAEFPVMHRTVPMACAPCVISARVEEAWPTVVFVVEIERHCSFIMKMDF